MAETSPFVRHDLDRSYRIPTRRAVLQTMAALGVAASLPRPAFAAPVPLLQRVIPASGERVPAIGMGTWLTFNVGDDIELRDRRAEVLRAFFELGGALIDSSPMYGSSEEVIGYCLRQLNAAAPLFAATKVWTPLQWLGAQQMARSERLWGVRPFDLMQIHNLVDWEAHLETLLEWKAQGRVRYIGITTSHGRRHKDFARIMREQLIDFVQFTYNVADREAEKILLPLAAERGLAVIVNRPFRRGALPQRLRREPLPGWAAEIGVTTWAEALLKFILAHPAVTVAIPATTRVDHLRENKAAALGPMPDAALRERIAADVARAP